MKKFYYILFAIFIIYFFQKTIKYSIIFSIELTTQVLLPALLPCIILVYILTMIDIPYFFQRLCSRILSPLYPCSNLAVYIFIAILSGLPASTILVEKLYSKGIITYNEYIYMIILTSNVSLAFILNYAITIETKISPIFYLMLFYFPSYIQSNIYYYKHIGIMNANSVSIITSKNECKVNFNDAIITGFKTLALISVYIMIATSILNIGAHLCSFFSCWYPLTYISTILEITTACSYLKLMPYSYNKLIAMSICFSFGGLCSLLQIKSIVKNNISFLYLIKIKMLNAIIALSISVCLYALNLL